MLCDALQQIPMSHGNWAAHSAVIGIAAPIVVARDPATGLYTEEQDIEFVQDDGAEATRRSPNRRCRPSTTPVEAAQDGRLQGVAKPHKVGHARAVRLQRRWPRRERQRRARLAVE